MAPGWRTAASTATWNRHWPLAQRAGKKARVRAIHTKIANRRKDTLHQFSRALVKRCGMIIVGDVSPAKLAKTTMAKSGRFSYGAALVLVDVSIRTPVQGVTQYL